LNGLGKLTETIEVHFDGDAGNRLSISILGYSHPQSEDYWDGNWIRVSVSVEVTPFSGDVSGDLRLEELQDLAVRLQDMYDNLSGTVVFTTMEDWLKLEIQIDKLGHVHVRGSLKDYRNPSTTLTFVMEFDQTHLLPLIKQLKATLSRFPIRGKR
jgi:hypothetical protein